MRLLRRLPEKYGSDATDKWIANLLTRARRQGVIKNNGIKSRPRWVESGSKGDLMLFIAGQLGLLNRHFPLSRVPKCLRSLSAWWPIVSESS